MEWAALISWVVTAGAYRRRQAPAAAATVSTPGAPAEQHFPVSVVTLYGLVAVTTVVLVFLAAVGVGA
jgi:hypothetical protein